MSDSAPRDTAPYPGPHHAYANPNRASTAAPLRVLVVHTCPVVRAGLVAILSAQAEFAVGAEEQCPGHFADPTVLVADYSAAVRAARHPWPQCPGHAPQVLVVTHRDREWEVRRAIDDGVNGYLLQECGAEELVRCVGLLGRGISYLSATATRSVVDSLGRNALTPREVDVLRVLAKGGSDKHIARELGIGAGTVKSHVKHLLEKLDATARTHAVVVAIERGLLSERGIGMPGAPHDAAAGLAAPHPLAPMASPAPLRETARARAAKSGAAWPEPPRLRFVAPVVASSPAAPPMQLAIGL